MLQQSYADDWFSLSVFLFRIATASSSICPFVWGSHRGSLGSTVGQSIKGKAEKLLPLWQNPSNLSAPSYHGRSHPPPTLLTLPYQSCVVERSEWRLCICGPPTQGWVSIFRASFGGDRQHGAGDGGQNVGTDGKIPFTLASWTSKVFSIIPLSREAPTLDSTAGTGWSGLSGEVEEKGGGTRNQREGLKLSIHFSKKAPHTGRIEEQDIYVNIW